MAESISVPELQTRIFEAGKKAAAARKAHNDAVSALDAAQAAEKAADKAAQDADWDFTDACDALMVALGRQAAQ